ncbi:MAG: sensor histidine kinase [Gemmatimonadota bacterium]
MTTIPPLFALLAAAARVEPPLIALLVTFGLVGIILTIALIGSTILQQRRYLRARERFTGRLLAVQDEERSAIARELHDDVVQRLLSLSAELRTGVTERGGAIATKLDRLVDDLRGLARGMHPSVVDHVGINEALRELAMSVEEREGLTVDFTPAPDERGLEPKVRLALYRIAQEALGNAARHSGVERVEMNLTRLGRGIRLTIADAGRGFDPDEAAAGPGIGLTSMRERLAALGGQVIFDATPGRGTRVVATLPLEQS